jgi:hypothetical protein
MATARTGSVPEYVFGRPGPHAPILMHDDEYRGVGVLGRSGTPGWGRKSVGSSPPLQCSTIFATGDMERVDGLDLHPLADRSEFLELSQVDAPHSDAGRHPIFPFVQTAPWCRAHAGHPLHIETTDYKSDGRSDRREAHRRMRGCFHR